MKTVLFLCRCGPNLGETIRLDDIEAWALNGAGIDEVRAHDLFCSPDGRDAFVVGIRESGADRVIVAACTPKMHEATFGDLAEEAGLNRAAIAIANLREQCAWVTKDPDVATAKARALIRGALRRVEHFEPLEARSIEVNPDLLVIGGGLAGVEAALTAARAGRKVTIVEREISLGGELAKTEEVSPTLECSPCLIAPRLAELRDDPNVTIATNAEITELRGFLGNFVARIRRRARYVNDTCIGCAACFDACPEETPDPFWLGRGERKAIYVLSPGSVPAAAAIDPDHCLTLKGESCEACVPLCPFGSIDFADRDEEIELEIGGVVVATGLEAGDVGEFPELGLGEFDNVLTIDELSSILATNGPSGGRLECVDKTTPRSAVLVHCSGSLREDGLPWCSGTCCGEALTASRLLGAQGIEVTHVHGDLVLPGPDALALHRKVREDGAVFEFVSDPKTVRVEREENRLTVCGEGLDPVDADIVVLVTGRRPSRRSAELAELLGIERTKDGFFLAGHPVLGATASATDGVYLAGAAAGPCDANTAVTRAKAAAGEALSTLVPGRKIQLESMTANIDPDACANCRFCLGSCPFRAIEKDTDAEVCRVNEALCRGCGTCAAGCPSGAAKARHFTDEEMFAEISGVLDE